MADQKISELTAATAVTTDDYLCIVDSPAAGAQTKRITATNFMNSGLNTTVGTLDTGGKLTAGANEVEGSNFDINGGTIDGVTIGGASAGVGTFTKVNGLTLGATDAEYNTYLGLDAGTNLVAGAQYNTFLGYEAGRMGADCDNTADRNVAIGYQTLYNNTSGSWNIVVGTDALYSNTTGYKNIAVGTVALYSNTSGYENTAVGTYALYYNTTGYQNTAVETYALHNNTTGYLNIAVGAYALHNNTTGYLNTAVGTTTLFHNTTGENNIAIGWDSGSDEVIDITTQSNYVVMGNNNTANANIKVAWTVTSDARDKTNFAPVPHGLDFVSKLKPTRYEYRTSREDPTPIKDGKVRYGLLAQDVLELEGDNPVVIDARDPENLKFNEASLIPILVNAIKELNTEVQFLKKELEKRSA